jgi:hypothetical protein
MPKAVLVMDMPDTCENCTCKYPSYKDDALYDCAITGKTIPINGGHYEDRPDWCPLRELPEKIPELKSGYEDLSTSIRRVGWNACLDEILK